MVRSILEGRKTQTRRIVRVPQEVTSEGGSSFTSMAGPDPNGDFHAWMTEYPEDGSAILHCPYGQPGDTLWVRETFTFAITDYGTGEVEGVLYRADPMYDDCSPGDISWRWSPSIHMPRWASRQTLRILDVRVQRLQEITEEDARHEGLYTEWDGTRSWFGRGVADPAMTPHARLVFPGVWDSINGKRAPWESNPYVWALTFEKITAERKGKG